MAKQKIKFPRLVSPVAQAAYVWVDKPDTKFAKSKDDEKYKLTLVFDEDDPAGQEFVNRIVAEGKKIATEMDPPVKLKKGVTPVKESDKEEFEGKILLECKTKFKPALVDSAKNELGEGAIRSGDLVRVSVEVKPYPAFGTGISLKLRSVQLIEKRNFGGGSGGADDFDEYEGGYVSENDQSDDAEGDDDDNGGDF